MMQPYLPATAANATVAASASCDPCSSRLRLRVGHFASRYEVQAQGPGHRLAVAKLHLEDHGMVRLVFDLYAPRGGVVRAGVDDRPREHCPGPDHPWRGDMRGAVVSKLYIEGLQLAHGGRHILTPGLPAVADHRPADLIFKFGQPADEIAREVKALCGRDAGRG